MRTSQSYGMTVRPAAISLCTGALALLAACSDDHDPDDSGPDPTEIKANYLLASVVIDADGNRTTYVQPLESLVGPFTNTNAIEMPGNGTAMADGKNVYVGLSEEPVWVKYSADAKGKLTERGRLSFQNLGVSRIDYGNVIVDDETAVSVLSNPPLAVVWNPATMQIKGEVPLPHMVKAGYETEVWTTSAFNGKVYIPGRYADWTGGRIFSGVETTVIDPKALRIDFVAEDDRCASGGRIVFDKDGYGYVMGDGRNYSAQMFANASGGAAAAENCILRIAPGATDFEADYYYTITSLTGGRPSITELEAATANGGYAFAKMVYLDRLSGGPTPVDFDYWEEQAHKLWRIKLAKPPVAEEVEGIPFSAIGFSGSALDGKLYSGESLDAGATSDVYETDPATNLSFRRFKMDGYFSGLFPLGQ